ISAFRAFGRDVAEGSYPEAKHQVDMDDAAYDRFLTLSQSL
ncbi:MAG: 3-methyl-2-oxobutanoate hydroxymethyltransferase, partial [Mesorhizobium sp.]